MNYANALSALADPTRRALFEKLRRREHAVGELAKQARISQPAVSQHLRVLRRARLVQERRDGTRHYYRASQEGLADLKRYLDSLWDDVLGSHAGKPRRQPEDS